MGDCAGERKILPNRIEENMAKQKGFLTFDCLKKMVALTKSTALGTKVPYLGPSHYK